MDTIINTIIVIIILTITTSFSFWTR